jgi:hypothetical protein
MSERSNRPRADGRPLRERFDIGSIRSKARRWLATVLIAAMALGGLVGLHRCHKWQRYCKMRAEKHRNLELQFDVMARTHTPQEGFHPYFAERLTRRATYHSQMARKWEHAAGRPWAAVAPDPAFK